MILIIDDDKAVRSSLALLLKKAGYQAIGAENPGEALKIAKEQSLELFILDMNFSVSTSGKEGLEFLKELKRICPQIPVILITAWGSIPLAVEGMKLGAADFICKPWNNERFLNSVATAISLAEDSMTEKSLSLNRGKLDEIYDFDKIIGEDANLLTLLETAGRVSRTGASILIQGESGTGKELIAEAVHLNSDRKEGPFIKVNMGGIPATLFESEMFGHKKGAFTDAHQDRTGRFEMAHEGTLFLDEIGDLDLSSQVKLLRVLQDGSFEVLGSSKIKSADFRLVCATNRDMEKMLASNTFREDLFYRINLITLKLPALRERPSDIPYLVESFVNNMKTIYRREELRVTPEAIKWLSDLNWPGNIRELKNLVERTVLISGQDILEIEHFQSQLQQLPKKVDNLNLPAVGTITIEEMEKSMIEKALEFHGRNISKVARSLGLSRAALYRRLEKYGIPV